MTDFRLRDDAERWFDQIQGKPPLRSKFDLYYFCLMLGLAAGRRSDPSESGHSAPEFVGYFIEDYKMVQRLIISLLIIAELKRHRIDITEKDAVRRTISSLVTPNTTTRLTEEGMRTLNAYASGGYEYLAEQRDYKPYTVEEFLRDYIGLIDDCIEKNPFWPSGSTAHSP